MSLKTFVVAVLVVTTWLILADLLSRLDKKTGRVSQAKWLVKIVYFLILPILFLVYHLFKFSVRFFESEPEKPNLGSTTGNEKASDKENNEEKEAQRLLEEILAEERGEEK